VLAIGYFKGIWAGQKATMAMFIDERPSGKHATSVRVVWARLSAFA
jgi:hypothetical protein